ncbi:class II aldolase/adducin family protein [Rhodovibrio salinarum]|uniref:class II aldolase/adducin family protein n=1 Tax=Rhodovibrio salinarum TaxID=1087 RepID=UPI0004BBCB7E|nr:class II aldolase/adducin family protein [Rhodovibrio salinarum]
MSGRDLSDTAELLRASPAFAALCQVSARLGADPLQVQGPGGNTSLKRDGVMWIKASGTWLADATDSDVMVPVDLDSLIQAVAAGEDSAERPVEHAIAAANRRGLRPSIETAVHAVLSHPVVLHTHCVATIAVALRQDAAEVVAECLGDLGAVFVPYVQPGLDLAHAIQQRIGPETRLIVLGNHGLVAAGADAADAEALLRTASARLDRRPAAGDAPHPDLEVRLAGSDYVAADAPRLHALARDPDCLEVMAAGSYYPDHVVFLGPRVACAGSEETAPTAAARLAETGNAPPPLLIFPGLGAAIRQDASASTRALAACLGEVAARLDPGAPCRALTTDEEAALMGWEAEAYRRKLDAARDG